jgi:phosphoenolpyruvate phosphomutase
MNISGQADEPWLLRGRRPMIAIGVHDGLGARIAEDTGFAVVWLSSLEMSASAGIPDANLLTMTDCAERAREIRRACRIRVIADCDNGYGNAHNVIHMTRILEQSGVDGICIEDKAFPKVNSFFKCRQHQVSKKEFIGKIQAAVSTRRSKSFSIIARVESLIAGEELSHALDRAKAYEEAGADAILIHSKSREADEILAFLERWNCEKPIAVVPTTYTSLTANDLHAAGASLIIYANHGLRASISAVTETFRTIARDLHTANVEKKIASMERVFELQGLPEFRKNEALFISEIQSTPRVLRLEQLTRSTIQVDDGSLEEIVARCHKHLTFDNVALIKGLPGVPSVVIDFLERIGPAGDSYNLDEKSIHPKLNRVRYRPTDLYSLHGRAGDLPPHSARSWSINRNKYFAMYMLDPGLRGLPSGQNGETRLVWWQDVLLEMQRRNPESFVEDLVLLMETNIKIPANNVVEDVSDTPLIFSLNQSDGELDLGIRMKADILEKIVRLRDRLGDSYSRYLYALTRLVEATQVPEISLQFLMEAGDLLIIDNLRLGHGRYSIPYGREYNGQTYLNQRELWSTTVA